MRVEQIKIEKVEVAAYTIPTDRPESDGTLEWEATTVVVAHITAGGRKGVGYSYTHAAAARLIDDKLAPLLIGRNALDLPDCWRSLTNAIRNLGDTGLCMMAVAAVDNGLWDLKAKLLDLPLALLLGRARSEVPIYGSGGFTSYSDKELAEQLGGWVAAGIPRVKMKIGRQPDADPARVDAARLAIGNDAELFADANGGYDRKQALTMAGILADYNVTWFEEPVCHRDRQGLRLLRDRAPDGMEITAGEYGFQIGYFHELLATQAVDVLQADATRCGITVFLQVAALCVAHRMPLSSHTAPATHLHPCCAALPVRHLEYFHDHVRIEGMLFDGIREPAAGRLAPDLSRPGLGIELKSRDAERFKV
ncbi:MAG: enolase C-terminal domain-like protein [Deltaproteobacteria bacterium]|jgi:L-alanine-DL-glutamate epimerase-like enolase superfamily enzyme